ncbi:uncharacterized protein LOC141665682 [Apium graveolens]|uniref:uncharacterized protein LOC141665682 n=1 Tax=Apium graveolens TaxID=4045 RepID=UPI003D7AD9CD
MMKWILFVHKSEMQYTIYPFYDIHVTIEFSHEVNFSGVYFGLQGFRRYRVRGFRVLIFSALTERDGFFDQEFSDFFPFGQDSYFLTELTFLLSPGRRIFEQEHFDQDFSVFSLRKVSDGSLKSIHLTPEETIIYNGLTQDDGTTTSWTLLEEFSLIHVGLSSVSQQAAKEINEDNVPLVEETARMKKARLAGLDTRGKATEPIFLRKHKEPMGEASTEGAEGHNAPITAAAPAAAATGAFQPLWGFRRGDTVVGSTKHAWDWSYHSVTPKDFTDVVATPDLERIKLMGAQSLASSNAYFQGAVRQAESWKRASDKADNALRRQQKKYATLEKKLKRKEEELGESNAELVVLRAEKDKAIDNYLDSEEFAQSMRIRDDSVFPEFFRTGWDTALGTVNEACPDINPADYICPDDEALLQRFRTRVVVSDHVPQDPLLPPPESFSRPAEDDSSSSSETTETSSESGEDDDMDAEGTSAP